MPSQTICLNFTHDKALCMHVTHKVPIGKFKSSTGHVQWFKNVLLHIFFISNRWIKLLNDAPGQQGVAQVAIRMEEYT